jgi:hypothetical protein
MAHSNSARWQSPEQLLARFEHFAATTSDPQFPDGIVLIREWIALRSLPYVGQPQLGRLILRFRASSDGSQIYDLYLHVAEWARSVGLVVPRRNPWQALE